jgi:conjugal transfer pilus assembly protein TrbC
VLVTEKFSAQLPIVMTVIFLSASAATASPAVPTVTEADIARARQKQPAITEADIEAARRKHQIPDISDDAPPSTPALDALPQPASSAPIDLEALARGYGEEAAKAIHGLDNGPALFIFVSLAMPRPTLERLIEQAARARAALVIRGFVNGSLRETVSQVQRLIGTRKVSIQIDPRAFDRYAVTKVPSFVLARAGERAGAGTCADGACAPPNAYLLLAGDVSLDYALDAMRYMAPVFGMEVAPFIERLKP